MYEGKTRTELIALVNLKILGNGSAWSGHLACTEDIRTVRFRYSPPKFGVIGYLVKLTALQAVELSSILSDSTKQIKEIIWYS